MVNSKELLESLRPEEVILILALRQKFKFGPVEILMRNGIPQRISQVTMYVDPKEKDAEIVESMLN